MGGKKAMTQKYAHRIAMLSAVIALVIATTASAQTYKILHAFTGPDGAGPRGKLVADTSGNLYGVTQEGGSSCGTVFELSQNAQGQWTTNILYTFTCGADGASPLDGLTIDQSGNLYGTTYYGGLTTNGSGFGVVFELSPTSTGTWKETVLHAFDPQAGEGGGPAGQLIFDDAGNLYGTTFGEGFGNVFRLSPTSTGQWTLTVLHTFGGGRDGAWPQGGVLFDTAGNLYGVTGAGGDANLCPHHSSCGVVFVLHPSSLGSWYESHLFDFNGIGGSFPQSGLIIDKSGKLYGAAAYGGILNGCSGRGCGVVYELSGNTANGWIETVIHDFGPGISGRQTYLGSYALGSPTFDSTGNLYGTTYAGGLKNLGAIYKLSPTPTGWQETLLHSFSGDSDGQTPSAGVTIDNEGNIFGTTFEGGGGTGCSSFSTNGCGIVWEITR